MPHTEPIASDCRFRNATDADGLASVIVAVRDAGGNGMCEVTDQLLPQGSGSGDVLQNPIDVTANAAGFSVEVQLFNPQDGSVRAVCFSIEAVDGVGDTGSASALTTITWLP